MSTRQQIQEKSRLQIKEPHKFKVVMYNDDFTSMEFVVDVLITIFHKNEEEAVDLMLLVHETGKAVVGIYSYDIARTRVERALSLAREEGYPFRVVVEE